MSTAVQPSVAVMQIISKRWASVEEAATYSGLSPRTIRAMQADGRLTKFMPTPGKAAVDLRELDRAIQATKGRKSARGQHLVQR